MENKRPDLVRRKNYYLEISKMEPLSPSALESSKIIDYALELEKRTLVAEKMNELLVKQKGLDCPPGDVCGYTNSGKDACRICLYNYFYQSALAEIGTKEDNNG